MTRLPGALALGAAIVLAAADAGLGAAGSLQAARRRPAVSTLCLDEQGMKYSPGGLRQVSTQVEACQAGVWSFDPSSPPPDPTLAAQKTCRSTAGADRGQRYASGLLRKAGETFERCSNGRWLKTK